jgi:hypothetical protein
MSGITRAALWIGFIEIIRSGNDRRTKTPANENPCGVSMPADQVDFEPLGMIHLAPSVLRHRNMNGHDTLCNSPFDTCHAQAGTAILFPFVVRYRTMNGRDKPRAVRPSASTHEQVEAPAINFPFVVRYRTTTA